MRLEGPRVLLRPLDLADAQALSALRSHPETARYQSWEDFSLDDAQALIDDMRLRRPDVRGAWYQLGIVLRESGELIGDCALRCPADDAAQAEIGFTLGYRHWGRGLAAEAVDLLVDWLFTERNKRRVFAVTDGRNAGAHRLLTRAGFERDPRFDRMVWFKGAFGPECVWVRRGDPKA